MAEPASKDSSGHYFEPSPSSRSAPQEIRLDLPDLSLTLATDRGVFSPDRIDTGTKHLLLDGPAPASRARWSTSAAATAPIACALARRSPAATVWAVDVNERALELCRANAERLGLANVHAVAAGRGAGGPGRRRAVVEPADPHRQGARCTTLLGTWLGRLAPAGRAAPRGAEAPRCRLAPPLVGGGGLDGRAPQLAGRLPRRSRSARREAARRHRHEAAAPRVAASHRRSGRARARRRAGPVQRRRHHPHRRRLPRRRRVAGRAHARTPTTPRWARRRSAPQRYLTFHRAETTVAAIDAARAAGYRVVGLELADGARPLHELAAGRRDVPRRRARGPRAAARPRWPPATRSPSCRCSARSGRSTSPPPRRSRSTSSAARQWARSADNSHDPGATRRRSVSAMVEPVVRTAARRRARRRRPRRQPRHARLGHRRGERGVGVAHRRRVARWARSPPTASSSASPATSTPTSRVPGGADVPAAGVTAVGVLSHHRRQGHLTRLMETQLRAMADRGIAVGLLVAAEWPIYGRFGYGPAIDACGFDIDARTARFLAEPTGSIEVVMPDALRPELERVHELRRRRTPGVDHPRGRGVGCLRRGAGMARAARTTPGPLRGALWRDAAGEVQGAVAYKVDRPLGAEPAGRQGRGHPARRRDARGRARAVAPPVRDRLDRHRHGRQPRRRRSAPADAGRRPVARSGRPVRLHLGAARSTSPPRSARAGRCTPIGWWSRSPTRRASRPGGGASSSRPTAPR